MKAAMKLAAQRRCSPDASPRAIAAVQPRGEADAMTHSNPQPIQIHAHIPRSRSFSAGCDAGPCDTGKYEVPRARRDKAMMI